MYTCLDSAYFLIRSGSRWDVFLAVDDLVEVLLFEVGQASAFWCWGWWEWEGCQGGWRGLLGAFPS